MLGREAGAGLGMLSSLALHTSGGSGGVSDCHDGMVVQKCNRRNGASAQGAAVARHIELVLLELRALVLLRLLRALRRDRVLLAMDELARASAEGELDELRAYVGV